MNTTTMAKVVATTARPIWSAPSMAASIGAHARVHPLLDVLDLDDGVVDQDADHQGQGQQGDHVEAEAGQRS